MIVKPLEKKEIVSRLEMLYKQGSFPTLRIPIKVIIARVFDMMKLAPRDLGLTKHSPTPNKCVAYTIEDNKEDLQRCKNIIVICGLFRPFLINIKLSARHNDDDDLLLKNAHISVDKRAITLIPERHRDLNCAQGKHDLYWSKT